MNAQIGRPAASDQQQAIVESSGVSINSQLIVMPIQSFQRFDQSNIRRIFAVLRFVAAIVVLKVTIEVVLGYRFYLPPDFSVAFLMGRERYFFGLYRWAFYVHLLAGPPTLLIGLLLVNNRFRQARPRWHRQLGKLQVVLVLGLLLPSGFWMSFYAQSGPPAGASFLLLTFLTAYTLIMGWRTAVQRRFVAHRAWMFRNYALLSSAVVLRIFGGIGQVLQIREQLYYTTIAWIGWCLPLLFVECVLRYRSRRARHAQNAVARSGVRLSPSLAAMKRPMMAGQTD